MDRYYFSPQIINDLFNKADFPKNNIKYIGEDNNILKRIELITHNDIENNGKNLIIVQPDNEVELIKKIKSMPRNSYLCSFEKLRFLESKSRYEKIFGKLRPQKIFVYSHRIASFTDKKLQNKINNTTAYCWLIWYRDENGFFNKETKLEWIY